MDITFKDVNYIYQPNTPMESVGLKDINLTIKSGSYTAIIGHTGSGKSTLLQHLDALLKPTTGEVQIGDRVITSQTNNKNLKPIRQKVGMVFQFAENQLFEATVEKDIGFGPKNFGASDEEANQLAKEMIQVVGLPESVLQQSPFDLSGGQMRRVAIAGVLAMKPEVLVLDEPTAGLDPKGRHDMMTMFEDLHEKQGITIVLVTHQMDDVADYADDVVVMQEGAIIKQGSPSVIFNDESWLQQHHLGVPKTTHFATLLRARGFKFKTLPLTENELADDLVPQLPKEDHAHG